MRKNYYLTDVVTKAKGFGFTDKEIYASVKEGIEAYERMKTQILTESKKEKKS